MVLTGLVTLQMFAFGATTQAPVDQIVRDAVDAGVHLRIGQPQVAPDQNLMVGQRRGDGAEHRGQVEVGAVVRHGHTVFPARQGHTVLDNVA